MKKTKSKGKKIFLIILCVVFSLLLILVIAGVFVYRSMTTPKKPSGQVLQDAVVETDKGKLQGRKNDGVYNFLGVEYAKADELFKPAKEVEPWNGVKDALKYGPSSSQQSYLGDFGNFLSGTEYSNDCQNLNIWAPENAQDLPVMVWLHGGGFSTGSSYASANYDGENLARTQNVIVIGVNHRLNLLGHLDLSDYGEDYKYSANVGIDDIVKALKWVKTNIASFGGNPDNVTLFGQSGGGAKILALMTSPYAKGLFHKAIVQSGATETVGVSFTSKEASKAVTKNLLSKLGISGNDIAPLLKKSYSDLMRYGSQALSEAAEQYKIPGPFGGYSMEWEPVVDGDYIPSNPVTEDSFAENGKGIPLLIGSNLYEWTRYVSSEQVKVDDHIQSLFEKAYPNENKNDAKYTDTLIRLPMLKIMSHKADQMDGNVYSYLYTYQNSTHGAEIPYTFANGKGVMNERMSSIWANFAKNGKPSADSLPEWENYTRENGACMILDEKSYMAYHHDAELLKAIKPDYVY